MDDYKDLEVYKYLNSLYIYFLGDIKTFENLAHQIELQENGNIPDFNLGSMFDPSVYDTYRRNLSVEGNEQYFRLTIPLTLSLFSVIDLLGYLIGTHKLAKKTEKNFTFFFEKASVALTKDEILVINRLFRQGLTHVYFPKQNLGVKFHQTNPKTELFFSTSSKTVFLNVNKLKDIVVQTFENIINDISLYSKMEARYQTMVSEYELDQGEQILFLKNMLS